MAKGKPGSAPALLPRANRGGAHRQAGQIVPSVLGGRNIHMAGSPYHPVRNPTAHKLVAKMNPHVFPSQAAIDRARHAVSHMAAVDANRPR